MLDLEKEIFIWSKAVSPYNNCAKEKNADGKYSSLLRIVHTFIKCMDPDNAGKLLPKLTRLAITEHEGDFI